MCLVSKRWKGCVSLYSESRAEYPEFACSDLLHALLFIVRRARDFDFDLKGWNTSAVTNMASMFLNCLSFEGRGLEVWDTSNVKDMEGMFKNAPSFNGDLSNWNVKRVSSMSGLFGQATSFNSDLSKWDLSSVVDISEMVSALVAACVYLKCTEGYDLTCHLHFPFVFAYPSSCTQLDSTRTFRLGIRHLLPTCRLPFLALLALRGISRDGT
jgi:surface protein